MTLSPTVLSIHPVSMLSRFSHVRLYATLWTLAHQVPLSMEFSRQEYWSGLPCPPPGDLLTQRLNVSCLLHWQVGSLPLAPPWKPLFILPDGVSWRRLDQCSLGCVLVCSLLEGRNLICLLKTISIANGQEGDALTSFSLSLGHFVPNLTSASAVMEAGSTTGPWGIGSH